MRQIIGATLVAFILGACQSESPAPEPPGIPIDDDDIAGVVTSSAGPEAGVWVIAETKDLGTRFIRSVVTDDEGRYVIAGVPTGDGYSVTVASPDMAMEERHGIDIAVGQTVELNINGKIGASVTGRRR